MIEVRVLLGDGLTRIEVSGHGRDHPGDLDGALACTQVSVATEIAAAYLRELAQRDPEHIRFTIEE